MELKYGPISPYVRKVLVVAHELGIAERIRLSPVDAKDPDTIVPANPLGKVPALILDDGTVLVDSPVICEYLDAEFGNHRLLAASGPARWRALVRGALADGVMDAGILVRQERLRPAELQSEAWIGQQLGKVFRGLDALERDAPAFGDELDLGTIAAGCAMGYLPLRIPETADSTRWPQLRAWLASVSQRPSFTKTVPVIA